MKIAQYSDRIMKAAKPTFPFHFAHLRLRGDRRSRVALRQQRGFTLVEMLVVVVIILLVATIAMPGVGQRMLSAEGRRAAESIGTIYVQARTRAMGRGSAVLVRFDNGVFQVQEAILGGDAPATGCATLPEPYCLPRSGVDPWTTAGKNQTVNTFDFTASGDFNVVHSSSQTFDVCFAPSGRAYSRSVFANPLTAMVTPIAYTVSSATGTGLVRNVTISSSGAAQVTVNE